MDRKTCPSCGAEIDADDPQGLCPKCLLKQGLTPERPTGGTQPTGGTPRRCPACQRTVAEDARFCAHCGTPAPLAAAAEGDPVRTALEATLQGQYRVVRLLGRGGMGAVYLARDLTLDREVAIKVVKTDSEAREVYDRFRREAKTAAKLSHPNIVPLHAFGEVEGMPYFVMGYVRGESLAARLRRDGKLPEDEGRRVLAEIADALDHAHRQGVVHRDIKPDNVLLEDESGRALLTDFGVAKALGKGDTMTRAGSVLGTPQYMSPEQASGRADIDGRSDIYSLGVMGYAMLAGRLPFEGSTAADILTKHLTQEPPPLRSLATTLSDSTVQVVDRCLAKDPAQRWPDARSLKVALGAIEESQLPDALQAAEGKGLLGAALVMALMAIFFVWQAVDPPPPETSAATLAVLVFVCAFFYLFAVIRLRREGFSFAQSQTAVWREPSWWPFWYPRALRRRGNVWDRLPAAARRVRWWLLAVFGYICSFLAVAAVGAVQGLSGGHIEYIDVDRTLYALTIVGIAATAIWIAQRARARRGLHGRASRRPTSIASCTRSLRAG